MAILTPAMDEQLSLYPPEAQAQLLAAKVLERVRNLAHRLQGKPSITNHLQGELYIVMQYLDTLDYSLRE